MVALLVVTELVPKYVGLLAQIAEFLFVAVLVVGAWAAGFTGFLGGSALIVAALTLAVGFAAQDVLSNFVAGVFIVQDRNFNIHDWIEWDGNAGFIDDIGFRVTRIRTFDNETITVPNTDLATNAVTNRMSNDTLRISTTFGIGYGDDIDETTRILLDTAAEPRVSSPIPLPRSASPASRTRRSTCRPASGSPTRTARSSR
ncbi:mechanosensitive ion channel family protein [Halorubrum amylolyticum]|uniref:mechanosensitive ion channel family protein n=1 Tax=Halorubrum amylolyticum TaxID=2508724 RepID=UPI0010091F3A|nr:mechanosensitive ion channel domain-containing protein [Halorubrum amylolyticum]